MHLLFYIISNTNGAHPLMALMSDSKDISPSLTFIRYQWLYMAASNYQSLFP